MKATIVSIALALALCGQAMAQQPAPLSGGPDQGTPSSMMTPSPDGNPGMPPRGEGNWWKNPELVQKLHLTDDQIKKIESIAQNYHLQEIDLRADVEKQDAILRSQMEADPPNEAGILAQVDKVTAARSSLEKSHMKMLLAVRQILTAEQTHMLRDQQSQFGPPRGFGPPDGGPGGPPDRGQNGPPDGPQGPPPNGDAN